MANAPQPAVSKAEAAGSVNWFGSAPNNSNRAEVAYANWIQTQDATAGTNLVSPLTLSATTVTTIAIPQNATTITLIGAAPFSFSEQPGTSSLTQSVAVPANTPITLQVARQANLYVLAPTGTPALSFFFQTL